MMLCLLMFLKNRPIKVWLNVCLVSASPVSPLTEKYSELYCLSFNPSVNKEEREESWNFIDLVSDYKRMGVPNNLWVMTAANSEYRVSLCFKVSRTISSEVRQMLFRWHVKTTALGSMKTHLFLFRCVTPTPLSCLFQSQPHPPSS